MRNRGGFTFVELVIVILVVGIMATVALRKMGGAITTAQVEHTKTELDQLAIAIVGNPESYSLGARGEFGYVGDVGAVPSNLDALLTNPGGYSTWKGPYIERGIKSTDFKKDAWGVDYVLTGTTLRSTGSGTNIDKLFAASATALTSDTISGVIYDANLSRPTGDDVDSLKLVLVCPNGSGGNTTKTVYPDEAGRFTISGVPIGNRILKAIWIPEDDTLTLPVTVYPGRTTRLEVAFPADLF